MDCPESLSGSAIDSFCEIEHLLSLVYFFPVIIIINNNTGNEVLSEPLLKGLFERVWLGSVNQINGIENKYQTVEIQMYSDSNYLWVYSEVL